MSKKISRDEYNIQLASRLSHWIRGGEPEYAEDHEKVTVKVDYKLSKQELLENEKDREIVREKAMDLRRNRVYRSFQMFYKVAAFICGTLLVLLLIWEVSFLPEVGRADRPTTNEVAERYLTKAEDETGAVNVVTSMILSYRAFDTFGETNVLFVATCCVMILLMLEEKAIAKSAESNDRKFEPKNDAILQGVAYILCPIIFIFGIYVVFNGHLSPGGGFSGGAIIGAGMILYLSAFGFEKTQRFFNEHIYKIAKISALCAYGCIILYYYVTGANGIADHIPLGIPGHILSAGIILPINIFVGLEVACTMYAFYALFRRGGL